MQSLAWTLKKLMNLSPICLSLAVEANHLPNVVIVLRGEKVHFCTLRCRLWRKSTQKIPRSWLMTTSVVVVDAAARPLPQPT